MRIEILTGAKEDLVQGFHFYEKQSRGLGFYFLDTLYSDIDSLLVSSGIHPIQDGFQRCLSRRFPFAIYYRIEAEVIQVRAVLDCRQRPARIRKRLKNS